MRQGSIAYGYYSSLFRAGRRLAVQFDRKKVQKHALFQSTPFTSLQAHITIHDLHVGTTAHRNDTDDSNRQ